MLEVTHNNHSMVNPPKRRRKNNGGSDTRIDRSRSTSRESAGSEGRAASVHSNWKRPQTRTVALDTAKRTMSHRPPPQRVHSGDDDDEDEDEADDDNDEGDDDNDNNNDDEDSQSDGDDSAQNQNQTLMKPNPSNTTYRYGVTTHTRTEANQMVQQRNSEPSTDLQTTHHAPNAIWNDIDNQMQEVKVEKTAVHDFVSNYLFPKLKFVLGAGINLEYSTQPKSICSLVMAGCHQDHSTEGLMWWGTAKKQTINEIKRLRNDASKNLKIAFLGKSTVQSLVT